MNSPFLLSSTLPSHPILHPPILFPSVGFAPPQHNRLTGGFRMTQRRALNGTCSSSDDSRFRTFSNTCPTRSASIRLFRDFLFLVFFSVLAARFSLPFGFADDSAACRSRLLPNSLPRQRPRHPTHADMQRPLDGQLGRVSGYGRIWLDGALGPVDKGTFQGTSPDVFYSFEEIETGLAGPLLTMLQLEATRMMDAPLIGC